MKLIQLATITAFFIVSFFISSCSKDDAPPVEVIPNSASSLATGRSGIVFNTNSNFITGTTFNVRNATESSATSTLTGTKKLISLSAVEFINSTIVNNRSAHVSMVLPDSSSTASGSLIVDLSAVTGTGALVAAVTLNSMTNGIAGPSFRSETGTLTITKLTSSEIEGNFNGIVRDMDTGVNTYIISNGTFAGRFQ